MATKGFVMYYNYLKTMSELSDAEFGRLVRAAMEYGAAGTTRQLSGNERFLFGILKYQIDIDSDKYKTICERNHKNGQNGGRPKIVPDKETQITQSVFDEPKKANINKNINTNKKLNKNITPLSTNVDISPRGKNSITDELFEKFWSVYPKKTAKQAAAKAFRKIPKIEATLDKILAGVEMWKNSGQWQDSQFIPYPATFLSQKRWEDEIITYGGKQNADNERNNGQFKPIRKCINEYPE
jgi:hypothetical protein